MLTHLSIRNYALIDKLEISFFSGFTTITGETGAGKSIILDALSLILGQRADTQVLKDKTAKCIIEGRFNIESYHLQAFFEKHNLDYDKDLILRREITPEGKSRAFVNDTPVLLNQLKEIGENLIDIHSQHHTLLIGENDFQLFIIDNYAHLYEASVSVSKDVAYLKNLKKQYAEQLEREQKAHIELDYVNFIFQELEVAKLDAEETLNLEKEQLLMGHVEQIKNSLNKSLSVLHGDEGNCLNQLQFIQNQLMPITQFDNSITDLVNRIKAISVELKDVSYELERIEEKSVYNPERVDFIQQRLSELYRLMHKHNVRDTTELLNIKDGLEQKIITISDIENATLLLKKEIDSLESILFAQAEKLSLQRQKVFPEIQKKSLELLKLLGMPEANLSIEHKKLSSLGSAGLDNISFLFSANKGFELKEIAKIASGGEISRLMLVFKSLVSQSKRLPTIIFDEIDTGMSGDIAKKTGEIMKGMASNMQVLTITHLAQIAAMGHQQFQVYKTSDKKTTQVHLKKLDQEERVEVIAQMLGDINIGEASRKMAIQLLS